jgi:hypothetical protein
MTPENRYGGFFTDLFYDFPNYLFVLYLGRLYRFDIGAHFVISLLIYQERRDRARGKFYPVRKLLAVHTVTTRAALRGEPLFDAANLVDPKHYYCLPDVGIHEDIPFSLVPRPPLRLSREEMSIKVRYLAGYSPGKAPGDLASACLELAAWNMTRYRGRRIGITGTVQGSGKDGEHLETSMPENVRGLLEPYMRKTI